MVWVVKCKNGYVMVNGRHISDRKLAARFADAESATRWAGDHNESRVVRLVPKKPPPAVSAEPTIGAQANISWDRLEAFQRVASWAREQAKVRPEHTIAGLLNAIEYLDVEDAKEAGRRG